MDLCPPENKTRCVQEKWHLPWTWLYMVDQLKLFRRSLQKTCPATHFPSCLQRTSEDTLGTLNNPMAEQFAKGTHLLFSTMFPSFKSLCTMFFCKNKTILQLEQLRLFCPVQKTQTKHVIESPERGALLSSGFCSLAPAKAGEK